MSISSTDEKYKKIIKEIDSLQLKGEGIFFEPSSPITTSIDEKLVWHDNLTPPDSLTPIKRQSKDICVFGGKSKGKNIYMVYNAFYKWLQGYKIYSNFKLDFPYTEVKTWRDVETMNNGIFLGDDFESWASSKFIGNREKAELLTATLDFGKRNIDMIWSCKRPLEIDKTLRAGVDYYVNVDLQLKEIPRDEDEYDKKSKYLDYCWIVATIYDYLGEIYKIELIDNLPLWVQLYDTTEEIEDLDYDTRNELNRSREFISKFIKKNI